jgi:hypothetical protein
VIAGSPPSENKKLNADENIFLQMHLYVLFFEKLINERDASKVGQVVLSKGKVEKYQSFWHPAQCSFLRNVLPELYFHYYMQFPSVFKGYPEVLSLQKSLLSRFFQVL